MIGKFTIGKLIRNLCYKIYMKKIILNFLILTSIASPIYSFDMLTIASNRYVIKLVLFYAITYSKTLMHEFGHAAVSKIYKGNPKIFIGFDDHSFCDDEAIRELLDTMPENVFYGYDPNCGFTVPGYPKIKKNSKASILKIIMGPISGIIASIIQFKLVGFIHNKFPYLNNSLIESLKEHILMNILRESIYGFVPLYKGDAKNLYTNVLKFNNYSDLAVKNVQNIESFTLLSTPLVCMYKVADKLCYMLKNDCLKKLKLKYDVLLRIYSVLFKYSLIQYLRQNGIFAMSNETLEEIKKNVSNENSLKKLDAFRALCEWVPEMFLKAAIV